MALGCRLFCAEPSEGELKTLYYRLDPTSISQHLAFYDLYRDQPLGQQALSDAWELLAGTKADACPLALPFSLPVSTIQTVISLINQPMSDDASPLDPETLALLVKLSKRLDHYSLKGHHVWREEELLDLSLSEIDLARGLFLSQFGFDPPRIQSYEAFIDLMALQILARLPKNGSPEEKIRAMNALIFDEMGFRFPPHSVYAKEIDLYTFLPSVLDSRRGVCLGVSILYLSIAQRLALPLEMMTPPGHIYIRYAKGDKVINIETTARGIHLDSNEYLSLHNRSLQQRSIKEVIGMTHFNHASLYWQCGQYNKALQAYQKAEPYLKEDPHFKEFMGYALILTGDREQGEKLLLEIREILPDEAIVKNTMAEDYLEGRADAKAIAVILTIADEDRQSILAKKKALEETLERCPFFRSALLSLAVTWLQLHRAGEALDVLNRYQSLDNSNPEVHYDLSVLYAQRYHYPKAWEHLQQAEKITRGRQYDPTVLKELRRALLKCSPEVYSAGLSKA